MEAQRGRPGLDALVAAFADGREVGRVWAMPGHAGFSYGVEVGGERYVLRVPPPGVRVAGPADVLRQGRIMRALAGSGVPVPTVADMGDDPEPWFAVGWVDGATIRPTDDSPPAFDPPTTHAVALDAVRVLRRLHDAPVPDELGDPVAPRDAVLRWDRFLERAADPELVKDGPELRQRLLDGAPDGARVGVVHGDFQWGNVMADGERVVAVVDWELARVGTVLDDLGWLCVFSDPESWHGDRVVAGIPSPEELIEAYGAEPAEVAWHRAFAGYAFGVIIGLNLMLHRRGKRPDPYYEVLAPSAPRMLARARGVLDGSASG